MRAGKLPQARRPPVAPERGGVAVEFALLSPLLALMFTGLVDLGFGAYESMQVQAAAAAGAQYAFKYTWDAAAIAAAVTNSTGAEGVVASPAPLQFCACPSAGSLAEVGCSATCPDGSPPGLYARVSAQLQYSTILSYPALPSPVTLKGEAVVRLR
jgi:hypothetical protein